jgi:hypothetical protein
VNVEAAVEQLLGGDAVAGMRSASCKTGQGESLVPLASDRDPDLVISRQAELASMQPTGVIDGEHPLSLCSVLTRADALDSELDGDSSEHEGDVVLSEPILLVGMQMAQSMSVRALWLVREHKHRAPGQPQLGGDVLGAW